MTKQVNEARFEIIDHPSDVGLVAYGGNFKETFENAAFGMFSLMAELNNIKTDQSFEIELRSKDMEELLVNWLNELICIQDSKKIILTEFRIYHLTENELKAHVAGEVMNPQTQQLHRPIKAATYNQLKLTDNQAQVIFDV